MNSSSQTQKIALVTGGASGIGLATAQLWAQEGYHVIIADRDEAAGLACVKELQENAAQASFEWTDFSKPDECEALFVRVAKTHGHLDLALNNAGIAGPAARLGQADPAQWWYTLEVNLRGVYLCLAAQLRMFEAQGHGCAINVSSVYGKRGVAGGSAYAAAKHAVIGLTRSAAIEYGRRGIRINAVCPGFIETPFTRGPAASVSQEAMQQQLRRIPVRRMGSACEVAQTIAWLASDAASYINGAAIDVDGGFLTT